MAGRDVIVHDVIVGCLCRIDCLLGGIDSSLLVTEGRSLGLALVDSRLDFIVGTLCLLKGIASGVDRIHKGGQLILGCGAGVLGLIVGIRCGGIGRLLPIELLFGVIQVLAVLGQRVGNGLDEVVLVLGGSEGGFGVLDILLGLRDGRLRGIEAGLLGSDVALGLLELGVSLIEGGLGVCRLGRRSVLGLRQLLNGALAPFTEGIEIGVDLAVPIGLLGLHVGLCGIQLGLLLVERLLGGRKLGICLVKLRLEGIELLCRGILGGLGIRYLLLEVGYLGLCLVDCLLGLNGGFFRRMDSGLGIDPSLLCGLDLLVCVLATRLGRLIGRGSILGRLGGIGLLRRRGIICRLRSASFWSAASLASAAA